MNKEEKERILDRILNPKRCAVCRKIIDEYCHYPRCLDCCIKRKEQEERWYPDE